MRWGGGGGETILKIEIVQQTLMVLLWNNY
jgi:hypothetical protein